MGSTVFLEEGDALGILILFLVKLNLVIMKKNESRGLRNYEYERDHQSHHP